MIYIAILILLVFINPTHINYKFNALLSIFDHGGYFDKFLCNWKNTGLFLCAFSLSIFIIHLTKMKLKYIKYDVFKLILIGFCLMNLIFYSITPFWDKYYVIMAIFIPILLINKNYLSNFKYKNTI